MIRLILKYADKVWDNCTQYEAKELENPPPPPKKKNKQNKTKQKKKKKKQTKKTTTKNKKKKPAFIVIGDFKYVSIHSFQREMGWETLAARRNKHKLTMLYEMKMIDVMNPSVHFFQIKLETHLLITSAMSRKFKLFVQIHKISILSFHQQFEGGINCHMKFVMRAVYSYYLLNIISIAIWCVFHLSIIQENVLVRFIMQN